MCAHSLSTQVMTFLTPPLEFYCVPGGQHSIPEGADFSTWHAKLEPELEAYKDEKGEVRGTFSAQQ